MKTVLKLLLEVLFMVIGIPIFLLLFVIGTFYTFIKHTIKWDYSISKQFTPILRSINLVFDGLANAGAGELLNDALKIKNDYARYGQWYETISAVTGLVKLYEKDTWLRKFLKVLGKNHCEEAITEMQAYYYNNIFTKR
ncbi:hypothetical protein CLU96_1934 [Chryseobacterium sp. 52]|uniref:hypothetical protein n=1 Tax=Chryseobacterium sp. 52 TaxID=2035213 RepID=UPI000C18C9FC|nr:hypothetical protein [Chryseobacterium sp. 52]PIF44935.1 hypothetical protein CLU96_1934 [Chryseobacterium sp. 52]